MSRNNCPRCSSAYERCPHFDEPAALAAPAGCVVDWPNDWPPIETAIAAYVGEFEWCGEDEEGREGTYTPNDWQRAMVADAINGLFDDDDFRAAWLAAAPKVSEQAGATHEWGRDGERCVKCGDKDWMGGPCNPPQADPAPAVDYDVIGAAFLSVLRDPQVAWRDTGAKPFINRVAALAAAPKAAACVWTLNSSPCAEIWESSCNEAWSFTEGGPADNNVRFCHGCGKSVLTGQATPEGA